MNSIQGLLMQNYIKTYFIPFKLFCILKLFVPKQLFCSFIFMRDRHWIFGSFYCSLNSFTSTFTVRTFTFFTFHCLNLKSFHPIHLPLQLPHKHIHSEHFFVLIAFFTSHPSHTFPSSRAPQSYYLYYPR